MAARLLKFDAHRAPATAQFGQRTGTITVGNVRHTPEDQPGAVYIGRRVHGHAASPLGNPFKIATGRPRAEQEAEILGNYKLWLWGEIKAKGAAWRELVELRDRLLAGEDLVLLCWCKTKSGAGGCHGDIVKAALEWMISARGEK